MTEEKKSNRPKDAAGLEPGTRIGKYEILQRIGAGGQSIVYKGRDTQLDRVVAIKQISAHLGADERFLKRFRAEAKILAQLGGDQSHIVAVYDLIEQAEGLFIAMEHVQGHSLREVLTYQNLALPVNVTLPILIDIASGLKVAHAAGVVHRDIKPGNILVTRDHKARITDFGVAAQAGQDDSLSLGTTKYMAPEVFTGATVDARVDVYSLGFLAFEMLTGREFFARLFNDVMCDPQAENVRWMKWHSDPSLTAPRLDEINPLVSPYLAGVVERMMAKNPDQRYATMDDVLADLHKAMAGLDRPPAPQPTPAAPAPEEPAAPAPAAAPEEIPTSIIPRKPIPTRKKVVTAAVIAAVVLAGCITLGVIVGGKHRAREVQAKAAWDEARAAYAEAGRLYRDAKIPEARAMFETALGGYEDFLATFGDLRKGTRSARAWTRMCQAQMAMLDGATADAESHLKEAHDLDVLDEDVVTALGDAIQLRADAVAFLDDMDRAIAAEDFPEAEACRAKFGMLPKPPTDQNLRAEALASKLAKVKTDFDRRRALAACDAALANAEANAALMDPETLADAMLNLDDAEARYRQAFSLGETDEVRARKTALDQTRRYVKARGEYAAKVADGAPLAEQVVALKAVVASRPPTEALRAELAAAQAAEALQRGRKLAEGGQTSSLRGAKAAFEQSLAFKKTPEAVAALAETTRTLDRRAHLGRAGQLLADRRFAEAIELLEKAQALDDDEEIADQLAQARIDMHLDAGDKARKARQWPQAMAAYEKARQVRLDDVELARRVEARAAQAAREKAYYDLLDDGRSMVAAADYERAVSLFTKAEQLAKELDVRAEEASGDKQKARYRWEITKGSAAEKKGDMKSALAFYKVAKGLMDTKEVRQLIQKAQGGGE